MSIAIGQIFANRYRIDEELGQGGFGSVYRAFDQKMQRAVAIKVLAPTYAADPDFQQRFAREARIIAGLHHPHIVKVFDFAAEAAGPYLVMELVRGGSLVTLPQQFRQQQGQPLPVLFAVELVRQAAEALAYAHAEDVIHRDIKPGNLLIEQVRGAGGSPTYLLKVADFGLARLVGPRAANQPLTSRVFCTPEYAAPEQLQLLPLDGKCDVFALGVVLYELLTGGLPGAGVAAVGGIAGPRALRPTVSEALDRLVLACLERDPARRPGADELATALAALRAAPTVAPAPAPSGAQTRAAPGAPPLPPTFAPNPTPPAQPRIRVSEAGGRRASLDLTRPGHVVTVGRAADNSIALADNRVSSRHLQLVWDGTRVLVTDLSSRNGTFLAGQRLAPNVATEWPPAFSLQLGTSTLQLEGVVAGVGHTPAPGALASSFGPARTQPMPAPAASAAPRPDWVPELVAVPAGPFLMGSSSADTLADDDEKPQHTVTLPAYWIGKTAVTNAQFRPFVEGDGYTNRAYWTKAGWAWKEEQKRTQPSYWDDAEWNGDNRPVVGVSWYEAVAYARWLSAQTGHEFREAGGAVLLFDEADALFGKRSEVKDSHDRYANLEVSYLLQRIEAYRGVAILTTNLRQALDSAFLRRLSFVVSFPFPGAEQREQIWRRAFPPQTPTEGLDYAQLARLNVAGGSIAGIARAAAYLAAGADEPVRMAHLLRAARLEFAKLDKPLPEAEVAGWGADSR